MEDKTMMLEEVASLLGKRPNTVRYDMCRHPERLPRWFKISTTRKPLWLRSTVEAFLRSHAAAYDAIDPARRGPGA